MGLSEPRLTYGQESRNHLQWGAETDSMAFKTIIDIPLGEHMEKCTMKLPLEAAAAEVDGKSIAFIPSEIKGSILDATGAASTNEKRVKRASLDGMPEPETPTLDE